MVFLGTLSPLGAFLPFLFSVLRRLHPPDEIIPPVLRSAILIGIWFLE